MNVIRTLSNIFNRKNELTYSSVMVYNPFNFFSGFDICHFPFLAHPCDYKLLPKALDASLTRLKVQRLEQP